MEISSVVIILFYIFIYIAGIFYVLAGEYLEKSNDLYSPFFVSVGIICLLIASRKIAHMIYSTIDNKQFVLIIAILLFALVVRYFVNLYRKNNFSVKPDALDNVFL